MGKVKSYKKVPIDSIKLIQPHWHLKNIDIDLSLQPDQLSTRYVGSGFHIYKATWLDLHQVLNDFWSNIFLDNNIWSKRQDSNKINKVLENWDDKIKLIPPMLIDNGHDELVPADGKHRLRVASFLKKNEIHFILFDIDLPKINSYFQPQLVN